MKKERDAMRMKLEAVALEKEQQEEGQSQVPIEREEITRLDIFRDIHTQPKYFQVPCTCCEKTFHPKNLVGGGGMDGHLLNFVLFFRSWILSNQNIQTLKKKDTSMTYPPNQIPLPPSLHK